MASSRRSGDSPARRRPSARRIRAARAYSGLERPAFAAATGLSAERLNYLENGKGPPTDAEEAAIQRAAGVPLAFLRHGFEHSDGSDVDQLDQRVSRNSGELTELRQRFDSLGADLPQRVEELDRQVKLAAADMDAQAEVIEALAETLERRFAELAGRTPQRDSTPARAGNPPRGGDPPAQ